MDSPARLLSVDQHFESASLREKLRQQKNDRDIPQMLKRLPLSIHLLQIMVAWKVYCHVH